MAIGKLPIKNSTPVEEIPHFTMDLRNYCYQVALYMHAAVSPEPTFEKKKAFDFFPMSCGFFPSQSGAV